MRLFVVLSFAILMIGFSAEGFAQTKRDGITYTNVTVARCHSMCMARGWNADNCKAYCRPGSCQRAKTGGEHFCVVKK